MKRGPRPSKELQMQSLKSRWSTPPSKAALKPSCARTLCIVIASMTLAACATSMPPSRETRPSPLVVASCPKLAPISDDSFGATTLKLIEVAGQYRECREAALAGQPVKPADYSLWPKR